MEEEAEKMAALKKAYADIILNTAKESAARILESERKALRFQQALSAAKEEALATLLRLKSLMDSKIREAETASLGQVRRIKELEVQLCEAEDTICYLREQLERVTNELYRMKNNFSEPLNEQNTNGHATSLDGQDSKLSSDSTRLCSLDGVGSISLISPINVKNSTSQKTADSHSFLIERASRDESLEDLSAENGCANNPDLASIIMRSKEPELYRNGCTQRIRALEHNLLVAKVPPIGQNGEQLLNLSVEPTDSNDGKADRPHVADSAKSIKTVYQEGKDPTKTEDIVQQCSGNNHVVKFFRRLSPRKQRSRSDHIKSSKLAASLDQEVKDLEPSKDCGQEDNITQSDDTLFKKSVIEESPQRKLNSQPVVVATMSCKRLNTSSNNGNPEILQCNRTASTQDVAKHCQLDPEYEISQSPSHSTEVDIMLGNSIRDTPVFSTNDMKNDILLTGGVEIDAVNTLQVEDGRSTMPDQVVGKNLANSDTKDDVPTAQLGTQDEKTSEPRSPQAGKDKFLKYTFRRKRKRGGSGGKDESNFPEMKSTTKKRSGERQNVLIEPRKPSLVTELPRNNRRLVQVARQLISLSEKRW